MNWCIWDIWHFTFAIHQLCQLSHLWRIIMILCPNFEHTKLFAHELNTTHFWLWIDAFETSGNRGQLVQLGHLLLPTLSGPLFIVKYILVNPIVLQLCKWRRKITMNCPFAFSILLFLAHSMVMQAGRRGNLEWNPPTFQRRGLGRGQEGSRRENFSKPKPKRK